MKKSILMDTITPRWLVTFLSWVPVEAGTYRVNKVKNTHPGTRTIECSPDEEIDLDGHDYATLAGDFSLVGSGRSRHLPRQQSEEHAPRHAHHRVQSR